MTTEQLLDLGSTHPTCIVPSVRTKGRAFEENRPGCYSLLNEQIKEPAFRAMSEVLLVHAPKGNRAPEVNVAADTPQVREAVRCAIDKGWPVVPLYEFRWLASAYSAGIRLKHMAEFKSLLSQYPRHMFALIHMAQLDASDAIDLFEDHPNIVFLTSHANTLVLKEKDIDQIHIWLAYQKREPVQR